MMVYNNIMDTTSPETSPEELDSKPGVEKELPETPSLFDEARKSVIDLVLSSTDDVELERSLMAAVYNHFDGLRGRSYTHDKFSIPDLIQELWESYNNFITHKRSIDESYNDDELDAKLRSEIMPEVWEILNNYNIRIATEKK